MSERDNRIVRCGTHGDVGAAFVCQHLVRGADAPLGFFEPDQQDDEPNAWCLACEEVLKREGEWNDASEAFARPKLVCEFCFAALKQEHAIRN